MWPNASARMRLSRMIALGIAIAFGVLPASAEGPWSGTWDTRWRGGGARLILEQTGDTVAGTYPLYGGRVEGTVERRQFNGRWIEGARSGGFVFALASDGRSFMGRYDSGEWWTGTRLTGALAAGVGVDQSTPRNVFRTFVIAGNLARRGRLDELGKALEVVEFGPEDKALLIGQKLDRATELFAALDQTTFRIWSLPERSEDKPEVSVTLKQPGTDAALTLVLRRGADDKWRIAMPTADALGADMRRLLGRHGGKPLPPDDHLKLRNPRAALRTFLEGMQVWDTGGRSQAASTLDLSGVSETVRAHEGALAGEYLKQVLDRVSFFLLQEVPDDGSSREPYALFEHPAGKVVLAPMGEGDATRWLFTAETVRTLRPLYAALENMPTVIDEIMPVRPAPSSFFVVRQHVGALWPGLLRPVGAVELWQVLGILLLAVTGSLMGWFFAAVLVALFGRQPVRMRGPPGAPFVRPAPSPAPRRVAASPRGGEAPVLPSDDGVPAEGGFSPGWGETEAPGSGTAPSPQRGEGWGEGARSSETGNEHRAPVPLPRKEHASPARRFVWPLRLLLTALFWYLGSRVLGLPDVVQQVMHATIALLAAIGGTWAGLLLVDAVGGVYHARAARTFSNFDDMLVSFATGAAKLGIVAGGAVTIADTLGIPWQGILAGLGIGGLAVAFASRETLSNIFGAGILLVDRPFRRGDWIGTADNTQGTVEQVGIRSTRIRTAHGTLVVVPNGKLVDATINNMGARRERLLRCTLAVSYDTKPGALEAFVGALAALPGAHPALVPGRTQAGVWQLTESAIEVEFVATIAALTMAEERSARQALLLDILRLAEEHGVTFAGAESGVEELAEALGAGGAKARAAE